MNVSGIPFLTEISNKSAESIRGGYSFIARDINGNEVTRGFIVTPTQVGATSGRVAARTHSIDVRSREEGGGIQITNLGAPEGAPGRTVIRYPSAGQDSVVFDEPFIRNIAGTEARIAILDLGAIPSSPPTCNATDSCGGPEPSGGGASASLAFFPSS